VPAKLSNNSVFFAGFNLEPQLHSFEVGGYKMSKIHSEQKLTFTAKTIDYYKMRLKEQMVEVSSLPMQ
jgi:hypothetical protein